MNYGLVIYTLYFLLIYLSHIWCGLIGCPSRPIHVLTFYSITSNSSFAFECCFWISGILYAPIFTILTNQSKSLSLIPCIFTSLFSFRTGKKHTHLRRCMYQLSAAYNDKTNKILYLQNQIQLLEECVCRLRNDSEQKIES